jgi:serine/threonine protein kinase/tetratricopeptide (TPR) repeat protein
MNTDHDKLVKEIFADALEKANAAERAAYLAQACGNDVQLRQHVEALLQAHAKAGGFLEQPAAAPPGKTVVLSTPLTEKAGDHIGHYKLLQQIGEGGCGVVYMAEQEQPIRRRVALKVIKLGMDTKAVIARFEAERQALALMDHPNIAKVLDAGATNTGRPYFVMELVRGIKITDYCDQNNLSTEQRLDLFVQICHAIQHAHQKGIIHRDIKPSNILVTVHDGKPLPKIIDFGIAKATSGQVLTDKTLFTAFEQFIGTPAYMSPEQAEMSTLDIDTRSDIYALGVLLYELLTGRTPFDQEELVAAGLSEMRRIIREQEPMRPSTRISTLEAADQTTVAKRRHAEPPQLIHVVRGDLDWIVMKCLEKDRTRRYETANGLADDVLRHLNDEPVTARPPGRVYRLQKLVRRNKLAFAVGGTVTAALVIGLALSTWFFFQERAARQQAVAAEQKAKAEASKSQQVAQFLKDMLNGVGPSVARGRDTTMLREILDKTAERIGTGLKEQPEVEAELRSTIGEVYTALGEYGKAEEMHRGALALRRGLWGNMNTNVADSLDSLGVVLLFEDRVAEAEAAIQEALTIRTNLLGSEHVLVAASLFHLGEVRYWQTRNAEAEQLFRQSLDMRKKLLGNENVAVAESFSGLSSVLLDLNKPEEAETAAREAQTIQARLLPEDERAATLTRFTSNPQILLGWALYYEGKLDERETVIRQQLTLDRKVLGPEHPKTVRDLFHLAYVLDGDGKLDEAEATAREGLALSRKTVGEEHSHTAACLDALGDTLRKAGRLTEAEAAYREELAIWYKLGDNADASYNCASVAQVLREQGKLPEAETLYREGVAKARKSPDPTELVYLLGWFADFLSNEGKPAEAEPLYREGLDISRRVNNFGLRGWMAFRLADVLENQGKPTEAESLYHETLEVGRKLPPTSDLVDMFTGFGDMLRDGGRLAEAESVYREGLDVSRRVATYNLRPRQWLVNSLAGVLRKQGKLAEAESLYRETLEVGRKSPPSSFLARVLAGYADTLRDEGKLAEAEPLYREGLDICRRLAANDFSLRQWLVTGLTAILRNQGNLTEAESLYRETLEVGRKLPPSSDLTHLLAGYADTLRVQGRLAEAEPLYREGLDICRRLAINDLEGRQWLAANLALLLQSQDKFAEAEPLYREAITNSMKAWPNDPAKWHWQVGNLGIVLRNQGKLAEAETFCREAVTNAAKVWPNDFKKWDWEFANLVDVLRRQGKTNEVERLRHEILPAVVPGRPPETINTNQTSTTKPAR